MITNRSYFTDDAVMTCVIAETLMSVIPKHGDIPSEKDFEVEVIKSMQKFGKKYYYDLKRPIDDIRPYYDFDGTCQRSVPEAIIAYLKASDFESSIRNAVAIVEDADTHAAIADAIAGRK